MFPDAEDAFTELLEPIAPVYTEPPQFTTEESADNPEGLVELPLIAVKELPGGSLDRLGIQQTALVEVQCFGVTRPESKAMRTQVRSILGGARAVQTSAGFLDSISEVSAPAEIPYEQEDARRITSVWSVVSRIQ